MVAVGAAALVPLALARLPSPAPTEVERAPLAPRSQPLPGEAQATTVRAAAPRPLGSGAVRAGAPAMQRLDPRRSNRSPHRAPRRPRVVWTFPMGAPIAAAPAVADGLVIVSSLGGKVAAVSLDGKERWSRDLEERIYGAPLVQGDVVRVGVDKGKLVTLDARTGKVKATLEVDGDADTAPAPTPDGGFVFTAGRVAYGARRDGTVRWRYKHRRKLYAAPAVGDDGVAYFGAQGGAVLAIAPDGELRWKAALGSDADAGLSVGEDGAILAGTDGGEVVALAPQDGAIRWRAAVGGFVRGALAVARDGAVLASSYGPTPAVVALDGRSGAELWRFAVRGTGAREFGVHGAPLEDAEGTLIFGAQDDILHALTPEGLPRWKLQLGGDIDGTAVLTEEFLLVGCGDGNLYALAEGGS